MLEAFLILCIVGLPLFRWRQNELARMIPLIGIAGIASIVMLVHAMNTPLLIYYDSITMAMIGLALWLGASLLWTDSHQSAWEFQAWIACLFICFLARYADPIILLPLLMATGIGFAMMSLVETVRCKYSKNPNDDAYWFVRIWFVFGNPVHNAAFLVIPFFISLWAGLNVNPWWFVATLIMGISLARCHSYGAYVGIVSGVLIGLILLKMFVILALILLLFVLLLGAYFVFISRDAWLYKRKTKSIITRLVYHKASWEMIKRRYLFGFGLNMFRKIYPELNPTLFKNEKIKKWIIEAGGVELNTGHRPHNDLADIAIETGILGLVLFCSVFYFINWGFVDPVFIGAFAAYAVTSLFFFPLREVHTAIGFWVFAGILMGQGNAVVFQLNPIIGIVLILLLCRIIYSAIIKLTGLYFFDLAMVQDSQNRPEHMKKAIGCDPYCARYLMYGFLTHIEQEPEIAFDYAIRQLMHFDGGKVKWGVYDQFARAILRLSGIHLAEIYVRKALHINPEYPRSHELLGFIHQAKESMTKLIQTQQGGSA